VASNKYDEMLGQNQADTSANKYDSALQDQTAANKQIVQSNMYVTRQTDPGRAVYVHRIAH
jgi:hypothetical protein